MGNVETLIWISNEDEVLNSLKYEGYSYWGAMVWSLNYKRDLENHKQDNHANVVHNTYDILTVNIFCINPLAKYLEA